MNLAAQREELFLPPAANVVFNGQADGFGFFLFSGDSEEISD
jgi:hypothetical protein